MKFPNLALRIVFMVLLLLVFQDKVYSADSTVGNTVYAQQTGSNDVTVKDVYDALLQTKDDKALIYEKVIDWLLATIGIVTGISGILAAAVIFWFQRQNDKLDKRINDINLNLKESQIRETNISNAQAAILKTQEEIDLFMKSNDFKQKLIDLESDLSRFDSVAKQWEAKQHVIAIAEREQKKNYLKFLNGIWNPQIERICTELINRKLLTESELTPENIANSLKDHFKTLFLEIQVVLDRTSMGALPKGSLTFEFVILEDMIVAYKQVEEFEKATIDEILL